jgi:hypothetical protein
MVSVDDTIDGETADAVGAASVATRADEVAMMRGVRAGLLAHCGASPSEAQRILVDRAT